MSDVHRALLSCPDITSLDLRIDLLGCSEWPDRWDLPFSLHGGESYPPLKSLRLEGYRFSDNSLHEAKFPTSPMLSWCERAREWIMSGNAFKRLCQYTLTQQQRGKINLDLWRDAMDFSRLEDLAFAADYKPSDVAFFLDRMATHLQGLKRLHLDGTTSNSTLGFLRDLNSSLTHLTVTNMDILDTGIAVKIIDPDTNTKLLASVVKSHGHSLQHLGIHTFENLDYNTPIIPAEELTTNLPKLPSLTHLTLNIRRNGTWPFEALATIASSTPNLTTLDLYLDIASQYLLPYINETTTLEVFEFLRQHKTGSALQNVTFWGGEWTRRWDGPLYFPKWMDGQKVLVKCTSEAEPGIKGACHVERGEKYWESGDQDRYKYGYP
ncbi:hypothetical protein LTS07_007045 [Exophiala sideris]|uniref:F-box domain-containing protein n=1 Tax=Exophiala sideris TaxID=1016849 RepID=A0ABR0J6L8_9EURO|nr:hypothetical protein LTS07_007045 [Exophiala sideris]KAK5034854.1 hypothetical protein LTR13_006036 [Exophiala sideris]KAK5056411.1 hypothetical protein LTR69_007952 [Exophiala sideris]KAK5181100.1 hypothetical protein LTR44_006431 [Eurotiomycetes sp. CCFEE 6388]